MSLVPAELLLAAAAVFTVIKIVAEQQLVDRKPIPIKIEDDEQRVKEEETSV